ncbi:MAG: TIM barrel protein [Pseudomonadota bacterium]
MPRFAANLSLLWPDLPYLDRFDAAAKAGFTGVEVLFPYDAHAKETQAALEANGLSFVLLNAPGPNYTGGTERGFAAVPAMQGRFAYDLRRAFRYAEALGAEILHIMAGPASGAEARACFVQNLRDAAAQAPEGLTLTIEPLNQHDQPGYFLSDFDRACEIIAEVGAPNLGLQYDTYHAARIHGDALGVFERCLPFIRHVQIGDAPDRSAPGTGTLDFAALFAAFDDSGYTGWTSAEFHPKGRTDKELGWMKGFAR